MCIYTKTKTPLTAKADITCYKILFHDTETDEYVSPFRMTDYTQYVKGTTQEEKTIKDRCSKLVWDREKEEYIEKECECTDLFDTDDIFPNKPYKYNDKGYIHAHSGIDTTIESLINIDAQLDECGRREVNMYKHKQLVVFRCIIPKGTEYLEGYHEDGYRIYASAHLLMDKEINDGTFTLTQEMRDTYRREREVINNEIKDVEESKRGRFFDMAFISYDNIRYIAPNMTYRYVVLCRQYSNGKHTLPSYSNIYDSLYIDEDILKGNKPLTLKGEAETIHIHTSNLTGKEMTNVTGGFFPVYNNYLGALEYVQEKNKCASHNREEYVIYECLIRYGTPYYIGTGGWMAVREVTLTGKMKNNFNSETLYYTDGEGM